MHLMYLKSIDAHVNLDRVAAVYHNVTNYGGKECVRLDFAASDSQLENGLVTLWISDPDDRATVRKFLDGMTLNRSDTFSAAEENGRM